MAKGYTERFMGQAQMGGSPRNDSELSRFANKKANQALQDEMANQEYQGIDDGCNAVIDDLLIHYPGQCPDGVFPEGGQLSFWLARDGRAVRMLTDKEICATQNREDKALCRRTITAEDSEGTKTILFSATTLDNGNFARAYAQNPGSPPQEWKFNIDEASKVGPSAFDKIDYLGQDVVDHVSTFGALYFGAAIIGLTMWARISGNKDSERRHRQKIEEKEYQEQEVFQGYMDQIKNAEEYGNKQVGGRLLGAFVGITQGSKRTEWVENGVGGPSMNIHEGTGLIYGRSPNYDANAVIDAIRSTRNDRKEESQDRIEVLRRQAAADPRLSKKTRELFDN